jgi:Fe-S-cluster containining protein
MNEEFRQAVLQASTRLEVRAQIARIYAELQAKIDQRRPICIASGRCCKFEEYGHRLFVTTMEMASFVHELDASGKNLTDCLTRWDGTGCPFQVAKLCGVHPIRPFGCRIFFCDPTATEWQQEQYEAFHHDLKSLHETMRIPYFYVEWREALKRCS